MQSGAVQKSENESEHNSAPGPGRQSYGRGMYLLPAETPNARRGWRLDYEFNGRRKTLSLGVHPDVSEEAAADLAGAMRLQLANGIDPSKERRKKKVRVPGRVRAIQGIAESATAVSSVAAPGTFKDVAERWYAGKLKDWDPDYAPKVLGRLNNHLYPTLGRRQVSDIEPCDLLAACQRVVDNGTIDTARRVCKIASAVLSFAVVEGWAKRDFSAEVRKQLPKYHRRNFAAITDPRRFAKLLRDIEGYEGTFVVRCALRLAPLLMLRPGEFRQRSGITST